jgi:superfamily II DNA/RNA helicase
MTAVLEDGLLDTAAEAEAEAQEPTGVPFSALELPKPLLEVLTEAGVTTAFPIQAATIPDALAGRDVLGRGQTGSGKTLAFGLPTLARLEGLRARPHKPLALVLVPTRELAMQVEDSLRPYARAMRLRIRSVFGGAPMRKQIDALRYGVEILVATPGRLSDLIERGECELSDVDIAILDEADQMCDMGFLPHVCELMEQVVPGGQRLLFSATLDGAVDEIVTKFMNEPVLHEVDPQAGVVSTMSHHLLLVTPQHKARVAAQIAGRHSGAKLPEARSIFFVRTQMAADRVTEQFRERGLPAAALHGGMTQMARTKTLEDFKDGRTPVLIATDVAARGIHVDGVDLVVHIDPPRDSKDYLHRAGRTARAGQTGIVASLILPKQTRQAERMMRDAGVTAENVDVAPIGAGGRWAAGGDALAGLTDAQEVPEPGEVPVFALPVRERERRGGYGDRGGDRGGFRRDRERSGGGGYGAPRRDDRGNYAKRDGADRRGGGSSTGSGGYGQRRDGNGASGGASGGTGTSGGYGQRRDGNGATGGTGTGGGYGERRDRNGASGATGSGGYSGRDRNSGGSGGGYGQRRDGNGGYGRDRFAQRSH